MAASGESNTGMPALPSRSRPQRTVAPPIQQASTGLPSIRANGTSWRAEASPTQQRLRDIWGAGSQDIHAVGGGGAILHFVP